MSNTRSTVVRSPGSQSPNFKQLELTLHICLIDALSSLRQEGSEQDKHILCKKIQSLSFKDRLVHLGSLMPVLSRAVNLKILILDGEKK